MALILASASPRRREMLKNIGLQFEVQTKNVPEDLPLGIKPGEAVELLAVQKARAVADDRDSGLVIGCDTVVVSNGEILGKPQDIKHAKEMLCSLQGGSHQVYTGIVVIDAATGKTITDHQCTKVHFKSLTEEEIDRYVASGEPMDKAGAYGVQGIAAIFITGVEGCYHNVVGLPLERLAEILKEFDYHVLHNIARN